MDEFVDPVHLETEHSADAFVERLGWAIVDAQDGEPLLAKRQSPPVKPR